MKINAQQEFDLGQYKGDVVKDEAFQAFVSQSNELGRQLVTAVANNLTFTDNMLAVKKTIQLVHGVDLVVRNPLPNNAPITGIIVDGCQGLALDSTGKPTSSTYDLGYPSFRWKKNVKADGSVIVNATFPAPVAGAAGAVGEIIGPITRLRSNSLALTTSNGSTNTVNVCTTASLPLTPGSWSVQAMVGFVPGATSVSAIRMGMSKTTGFINATGSDLQCVPTASEVIINWNQAAAFPNGDFDFSIGSFNTVISVATPLFLVANATFTAGTLSIYGSAYAIRTASFLPSTVGAVDLIFIGG